LPEHLCAFFHKKAIYTASVCDFSLRGGGEGTLLYKLYRYVPSHRIGFLSCFGLKMGIAFVLFGLESGIVFKETTGVYECNYKMNKK